MIDLKYDYKVRIYRDDIINISRMIIFVNLIN